MVFATFDFNGQSARELQTILREWSNAAARMCSGKTARPATRALDVAEADTGETQGRPPAALTVTFGLGPAL